MHWSQLEGLAAETGEEPFALLEALFPGARYVRIVRDDLDRQAVSLWIAMRTGVWSERVGSPEAERRRVPYTFSRIRDERELIARSETLWTEMFASAGIEPFVVRYEELAAHYETTVAAALEAATGSIVDPAAIAPPESRPQGGDGRSTQLLDRFRPDHERFPDGSPFRLDEAADLVRRGAARARRTVSPGTRSRH